MYRSYGPYGIKVSSPIHVCKYLFSNIDEITAPSYLKPLLTVQPIYNHSTDFRHHSFDSTTRNPSGAACREVLSRRGIEGVLAPTLA